MAKELEDLEGTLAVRQPSQTMMFTCMSDGIIMSACVYLVVLLYSEEMRLIHCSCSVGFVSYIETELLSVINTLTFLLLAFK